MTWRLITVLLLKRLWIVVTIIILGLSWAKKIIKDQRSTSLLQNSNWLLLKSVLSCCVMIIRLLQWTWELCETFALNLDILWNRKGDSFWLLCSCFLGHLLHVLIILNQRVILLLLLRLYFLCSIVVALVFIRGTFARIVLHLSLGWLNWRLLSNVLCNCLAKIAHSRSLWWFLQHLKDRWQSIGQTDDLLVLFGWC